MTVHVFSSSIDAMMKVCKSRLLMLVVYAAIVVCFIWVCHLFIQMYTGDQYVREDKAPLKVTEKQFPCPSVASSLASLLSSVPSPVRVATPGENLRVGDLDIHFVTAVSYNKLPGYENSPFTLALNGWVKHNTNVTFKCCLLRTLPAIHESKNYPFVEVQASVHYIYTQWIVDMQSADFTCSIPPEHQSAIGDTNFNYVTFAVESCDHAPPVVMKILHPEPVPNSVGLCLKISYGSLNAEQATEWFEYTRLMGVKKVFTFHWDLDPPVFRVFDYYNSIGYLDLVPIHPAKSKDGPERGVRRPRYEEQAWVDEVMAANDCRHRMAGFDYVIVMDIDEFIVPKTDAKSLFDVLQAAEKANPDAACYRFDSHVMMLDWGVSRRGAPLHITRYIQRTVKSNLDGWARQARWGFKPTVTEWVKNNDCIPQTERTSVIIPENLYTLLHYRSCKPKWPDCKTTKRIKDMSVVEYETRLVQNILDLPHTDILRENRNYINALETWKQKQPG